MFLLPFLYLILMHTFVIGASGFLGRELLKNSSQDDIQGSYYSKKIPNSVQLDISDENAVQKNMNLLKPKTIIHCGTIGIDECEKNPILAEKVMIQGLKNILEVCVTNNIHLIYISSDAVFGNSNDIHKENDKPSPSGIFGKVKAKCESLIKDRIESACIIRTSLLYGWNFRKDNFATWVIDQLERNHPIKVIDDQFVTPSYCKNIAELILEAESKKMTGIFHLSGNEMLTRSQFAFMISKVFNLNEKLIIPTPFNELDLGNSMIQSSPLDNSHTKKKFEIPIKSINESLNDMLSERKTI